MPTRNQSTTVDVYNPFVDKYENLFCEASFHYDGYKLMSVEITKLISDADVDMYDYLNPKVIDDLEQKILEREV